MIGLNSPHHASHGSSVEDSDASTKEDEPPLGDFTHIIHKEDFTDLIDKEDNHVTSKVNGSSSSPFIMIEKLPYMNGDHDHTITDDIEELNHDDVNNSSDSINAHTIIQSAAETTNGIEDSHYASNEHYPNSTKPVVTEIEIEDFNSNSKEETTSASDGILSPIKPIAVEGNITTLSDAILISPPKVSLSIFVLNEKNMGLSLTKTLTYYVTIIYPHPHFLDLLQEYFNDILLFILPNKCNKKNL